MHLVHSWRDWQWHVSPFEVLVAQKEGLCKLFIEMSWEHQEDVLCHTLNLPASEALPSRARHGMALNVHDGIVDGILCLCISSSLEMDRNGWLDPDSREPGICGQIGTPSSLCGKTFTKVA